MPSPTETTPVGDSVAKINNEFAVGADPQFQKRWSRFERIAWIVLVLFVLLSFIGVFGRGPVAHVRQYASDRSVEVTYDRVQRFGTPSILTVHLAPETLHDGVVQLWTSESLVKSLGTQRVVPQPVESRIENGGILYTFPAAGSGNSVEFALEPASLGGADIKVQVVGKAALSLHVFVMP